MHPIRSYGSPFSGENAGQSGVDRSCLWYYTGIRPIRRTLTPAGTFVSVSFLIGIDGGGTGTRARLCGADGRPLAQGEAGPSGLVHGIEQAWRQVLQAVAVAFERAGL